MDTHAKVISLKVNILKGGLTQKRRVRLYEPGIDVVKKVVREWVCGGFVLHYVDDEGDEVLMDTEEEWQECVYLSNKQGLDVVKIIAKCTGRARSCSVSSASSSYSSSTCSTSTASSISASAPDEDVREEEQEEEQTPVDTTESLEDEEDAPLVPIEDLLAAVDQDQGDQEAPIADQTEVEVPTPTIPLPDVAEPEPILDIDPVPTPRSMMSAEDAPPTPTAEAFEPFRDYDMSQKIEAILRRLYGGSYVDLLVNGALTPEGLGCQEWLLATPSPSGCYFEVLSSDAIVKKLSTVGEGQMEKHDYEGAALWFEMCTELEPTNPVVWFNYAKAQALYERIECVNALAMAVGYGGEEMVSKAEKERAFQFVSHLQEFKDTIPNYDAVEEQRRKCQGCNLLLGARTLPMQKFCCGRCRSHKGRGHTLNCRGEQPPVLFHQTRSHVPDTPYRYQEEVLELLDMGFNDIDQVKRALVKHQGSVEGCLLELLN